MAKLFELTIKGTYQAQQIINRFNFVTDNDIAATSSAASLLQAAGLITSTPTAPATASMLHRFLQAQTENYQMDELMARNLFDVTDFYTATVSGGGWNGEIVVGADGLMSFVAQKIRTNRVRTDIRRGTAALTPPTEEAVDANGNLAAGQLTVLQALCTELNNEMERSVGADITKFLPAVMKKLEYNVPNTNPVRTAYKYYPSASQQLANTAYPVAWEPVGRVTSQVSRRVGKGS